MRQTAKVPQAVTSVLFVLIPIIVAACSGGALSRAKAAQLIQADAHYPRELGYGEIEVKVTVPNHDEHSMVALVSRFDQMKNAGLLEYQTGPSCYARYSPCSYEDRVDPHTTLTGTLTEEANKHVVGIVKENNWEKTISVKTGVVEFGEVTGIVERKELNLAEVTYTEETTAITPFGRILNIGEGVNTKTVTFTKYDDGWRVTH